MSWRCSWISALVGTPARRWLVSALVLAIGASVYLAGTKTLHDVATWTVPPASADITFLRSSSSSGTCESSGCHSGLKVVEQIHPLFSLTCVDCHGGNDRQKSKLRSHVKRPAGFGRYPLRSGRHPANRPPTELRGPAVYKQGDLTNEFHKSAAMLAYRWRAG